MGVLAFEVNLKVITDNDGHHEFVLDMSSTLLLLKCLNYLTFVCRRKTRGRVIRSVRCRWQPREG